MGGDEKLKLSDDSPKQNPWRDDRLGFRPFAERLSTVIRLLDAPNGYVFGLHGEWGSGKSTAINFVTEFLIKHNVESEEESDRVVILDFRPWIVSGHQDLITAFFQVLSEELPGAKRPRWFNRLLRPLKWGTDPLLEALATVAVVVDPSGGIGSKTAAKLASKSLNGAIDRFLEEPSLQAAYQKLHKLLRDKAKKFLVIIDDLDRLQKDEIRSVMQMVKTVGRLPNVIYLLSYDRKIVWGALDEGTLVNREGPNFGEKIVQQELELPRPLQHDLLALLDSEIAFLTGPIPNSTRWHVMVRDGVHRWIRQPRDVHRLSNAVKFAWLALRDEIDPQDLLIMEGLRLFDDLTFDWIRWNRDWIFGEGRYLMMDNEDRKPALQPLTDQLSLQHQAQIMTLLGCLFPSRSKLFEGRSLFLEDHSEVVRRRGIGCEAGYDAYFTLYPSPNAIPKKVIDLAVAKLDDKVFLVQLFQSYLAKTDRSGASMIGRLLQEVTIRLFGRDVPKPTQALLDALFDVGEGIMSIEWDGGLFLASPNFAWRELIDQILDSWGVENAGRGLESAFTSAQSVVARSSVFVEYTNDFEKASHGASSPKITSEVLNALGAILLPAIEKDAAHNLQDAPRIWDVMRAWKYLGGAAQAKAWLSKTMIESADFLASVTRGFVSYSVGSQPREYSMRERPDSELYDIEVISRAAKKHLQGNLLTEDERIRIGVVAEGADRIINEMRVKASEQEGSSETGVAV